MAMEIQRKLILLYVYAFATEMIELWLNFSRYRNALLLVLLSRFSRV